MALVDDWFETRLKGEPLRARKVLLATGIYDEHPPIDNWEESVRAGKICQAALAASHIHNSLPANYR